MMKRCTKWSVLAMICATSATAMAAPLESLDDICFWVGSGRNRAALVVDWIENDTTQPSLVWGYRWDGTATAEDLILDVVATDSRLFAKISVFSFGTAVSGIGYDANDNGFALDDGTIFDSDGLDVGSASDGVSPLDTGDYYAEGFFLGFWHYGSATSNPYDGGTWESSQIGISDTVLTDGSWHGLTFTSTFDLTQFPENPECAVVPEASSLVLCAIAAIGVSFRRIRRALAVLVALTAGTSAAVAADPWADTIVDYQPGTPIGIGNPGPYQTDGSQALGAPTRDTGFGSQVGVFYTPFQASEVVIIGPGGSLTVQFDEPIHNNPNNPFGIDLLVFGNAFFTRSPQGLATGIASEPGVVEVSQDGTSWLTVPGAFADGLFPTLGYRDTVYNGSGNFGGVVPTSFTQPVDPAFDPIGKTELEINTAYAGSGGGLGVDIGLVGLSWIQFVRVSQSTSDTWTTEIDAFARVSAIPEVHGSSAIAVSVGVLMLAHRGRSTMAQS